MELYADEFALIPAMHYRWGSALGEASARARFVAMIGSEEQGERAADRMVKARYVLGASVEAGPAIEAHTADLLAALSTHFGVHPYLLGGRQSFADCALMGPVDGHFFCDLVSRRLLLETARPVVGWIERCKFPNAEQQTEWLQEDALAPSLLNVLAVMGADAAPLILDAVRAFETWADERPRDTESPPRAVGQLKTTLRGLPVERALFAYTLYSVQLTLDFYNTLDAEQKARADAELAATHWPELLRYKPRHRLRKAGFDLVFDLS